MNTEFRLMPEQASSIAAEVDALYGFLLLVSGVITLIIAGLIVYFAVKYRQGSRASRTVGKTHFFLMEASWIGGPFVLTMIMFFWGARLYFVQARPPRGATQIDCVARQWMWKFQHPEGNAEINDLHVPLGQAVKVNLISEDVIHSLYVPAFRIKHDVLPGRYTSVWFQPTKTGRYHLFCAEYCGAKHSEMGGYVYVMEPRDYQAWLSGESINSGGGESGRTLFEQMRCNSCHQGGGTASRGPPLDNVFGSQVRLASGATVIADKEYIRESILNPQVKIVAGYAPIMPSYAGQIGEEGLLKLITYIKSMSKAGPPPIEDLQPDKPTDKKSHDEDQQDDEDNHPNDTPKSEREPSQ